MQELITELKCLLAERSIRLAPPDKPFTLASGAKSTYYFDSKATVLSPRGAILVGEIFYRILADLNVEAVGGLAVGSVPISTAVSLISGQQGSPIYGFLVRDESKDHGLMNQVDESYCPDGPLLKAGRRVAIVDDVVTKGGSILKAIREVQARGCDIQAVLAVVDRQAGGGKKLRESGLRYRSLFVADETGALHVADDYATEPSGVAAIRAVS